MKIVDKTGTDGGFYNFLKINYCKIINLNKKYL